MEVLSHRGYWKTELEKNSLISFNRSFEQGFGLETDLRDFQHEIVISHNIPEPNCMLFKSFLDLYLGYKKDLPLALNIKADGLHDQVLKLINEFSISNYFLFDMSIPDTLGYISRKMPFFTRQSEYEREPAFLDKCEGIWLDAFESTWFTGREIKEHLNNNKKVAVVSSELHKRDHEELWEMLRKDRLHEDQRLYLCTDLPGMAKEYFK